MPRELIKPNPIPSDEPYVPVADYPNVRENHHCQFAGFLPGTDDRVTGWFNHPKDARRALLKVDSTL